MKYCTDFKIKYRHHLDDVSEIKINYNENSKDVIPFLKEFKDKIIILNLNGDIEKTNWDLLQTINENDDYANIKLCYDFNKKSLVKSTNIPFMFSNIVTDFDMLNGFIALGVCDVYIGEVMGFYLKDVARVCKDARVQVRAFPDVAQSSMGASDPLRKFFIRPDDVEYYEDYIDILEFYQLEKNQLVLLEFYQKGYWHGRIDELIVDAPPIDNRAFAPFFANRRINCKKKCARARNCHLCDWVVISND